MLWGKKRVKRLAVTVSRTQDTSGLSRQCSTTEQWQSDSHQSPIPTILYNNYVLQLPVFSLSSLFVSVHLSCMCVCIAIPSVKLTWWLLTQLPTLNGDGHTMSYFPKYEFGNSFSYQPFAAWQLSKLTFFVWKNELCTPVAIPSQEIFWWPWLQSHFPKMSNENNDLFHTYLVIPTTAHRCDISGCGKVLVLDGNMKNSREVCLATHAECAKFQLGIPTSIRLLPCVYIQSFSDILAKISSSSIFCNHLLFT